MLRRIGAGLAALAGLLPASAAAHGFGRLYNLPVPFWLYAWAAVSALLLSFLLLAVFFASPPAARQTATRDLSEQPWVGALRRALPALQLISVLLLVLCIATGWFGNRDPYRNFSMTFFWVVFLLGFSYLTALIGDFYALLNPWRVLSTALARGWAGYGRGRIRYPAALGDWPALGLYLAFIWFELFGLGRPRPLAEMLVGYSLLNLVGVWLVGSAAWFRHCEFFAVFLRLMGRMAVLDVRPAGADAGADAGAAGERGRLLLRHPFAGLLRERPEHLSTVVFALAMLATTTFDGLRATLWWVSLFWRDPTGLVTALAGARPMQAYAALRPWYVGWETLCLVALPFIYFAAYWLAIALARWLAGSSRPVRELALDFGYTLLPIALVYHLAHYATLMLNQGLKIVSLASDPFGWGWNLFGTANLWRAPFLPGMGTVWHVQVGLILVGHLVSVYLAHHIALRVLATRRQALASQLPMLALMMLLTVLGLWIIAQPLTAERML